MRRNCSTSWLKAAPPTMTSAKRPPKALTTPSRTVVLILSLMMGTLSNSFMVGVSSFGSTFFLIIFSIISGTATTRCGFTSENAWKIIFGLGIRVRKYIWHPAANSYRNSNASPYMCAIGSMEIILSPAFSGNTSNANAVFDHRLR